MAKWRKGGPKVVPTICKKCKFRAVADPAAAEEVQRMMVANEAAGAILWEVVGRAMNDAYHGCPSVEFDTEIPDWCKTDTCVCGAGSIKEDAGDTFHPYWKCWTRWIGEQMMNGGRYCLSEIRARLAKEDGQDG